MRRLLCSVTSHHVIGAAVAIGALALLVLFYRTFAYLELNP